MSIAVIGDVIIDEYWHGESYRISPEAPLPVIDLKYKSRTLGGAGNLYTNISNLVPQNNVTLYGLGEPDMMSDHLCYYKSKYIYKVSKMPKKVRIYSSGHYMCRVDDEVYMDNSRLLPAIHNIKSEYVVLSDYAKGTLDDPSSIIKMLNDNKCKVVVDPKLSLDEYRDVFLLKPNRLEFENYVGKCEDIDDICRRGETLREELNVEHLIITLGSGGCIYINQSGCNHIPCPPVSKVFDVTGAGDSFLAGVIKGLYERMSMVDSIHLGNKVAGIAVSNPGTYVIQSEDLL